VSILFNAHVLDAGAFLIQVKRYEQIFVYYPSYE
jgi:hypothetical protein